MPTLTEIVENNPSIEEQDLTQLFTRRLDVQSQVFFLQIGFLLGILAPSIIQIVGLSTQPVTPSLWFNLVAYFLFDILLVFALYSLLKVSPSTRHETLLKDYLKARQKIRDKAKLNEQPHPP